MSELTITITGPVGSGKSAVAGEIEIALRAIGVPVRYADEVGALSEKRMTHADWQHYLDMYKPSVVLVETMSEAADETDDRARRAYDAFCGGFGDQPCPAPSWDEAPSWIRDIVRVAYFQGTLDRKRTADHISSQTPQPA